MLTGRCNCGSVSFTVATPQTVTACHCGQCRKQSGHFWVSAHMPLTDYTVNGEVRWYASSAEAQRGFCPACGCFLFWKHLSEDKMSFSLGAIDGPTGLRLSRHIFTADKGDYYDIEAGVPQQEN